MDTRVTSPEMVKRCLQADLLFSADRCYVESDGGYILLPDDDDGLVCGYRWKMPAPTFGDWFDGLPWRVVNTGMDYFLSIQKLSDGRVEASYRNNEVELITVTDTPPDALARLAIWVSRNIFLPG